MTPDIVETFIRAQFEPLQYAAFFGVFLVFALLEVAAPRDEAPAERLWRWPSNWVLTALNIVVLSAMPVGVIAPADYAHGQRARTSEHDRGRSDGGVCDRVFGARVPVVGRRIF